MSTKKRKREIRKHKKFGMPLSYRYRRYYGNTGWFNFPVLSHRFRELPAVRRIRVNEIPENLMVNRFVKQHPGMARARGYGDWRRCTCLRGVAAHGGEVPPHDLIVGL